MKNPSLKKNIKFFNKIASYYDSLFGNWVINLQKQIIFKARIKNNSVILDAGFGTGNLLHLLENSRKKLNLHGIDVSENMLLIAKTKLKSSKLKLASVEKMPYPSNYFNYIFSTDAFHHYSNQLLAIKNFYKTLRKDGRLFIVDLDFGSFFNFIFHLIEPGNTKLWKRKDLLLLLRNNGFKDVDQEKIGFFTYMTSGKK